jgi:hypothetical protein
MILPIALIWFAALDQWLPVTILRRLQLHKEIA